jgi:hypothetical protein
VKRLAAARVEPYLLASLGLLCWFFCFFGHVVSP